MSAGFFPAPAPGSTSYLLRHELRIGWRRSGLSKPDAAPGGRSRGRRIAGWIIFLIVAGLLQIAAFPIARMMTAVPDNAGPTALGALTGGIGVLWALMLSHALDSGTQAIFLRGDHDLLISSPVPPRRVFAIRALTIAVNIVTVYAAITLPLAVALLWYGQWRWLAIYPTLASLGLSAAAIGLTLCFALFDLIGPRRTRIVAQVLGAAIGASIFFIPQSEKLLPPQWRAAVISWLAGPSEGAAAAAEGVAAFLPARALLGEFGSSARFFAAALAAFALMVWCFGERFARNAVMASDLAVPAQRAAQAPARARPLRVQGLLPTQLVKEWRLLRRDPWLISQSLMQTLYLLPICFAFAGSGSQASLLAPMTVILAGNLASGLVWITLRAEDAPDLIASAPVSPRSWFWAKLLAALTPVALILLLPLAALASQSGAAALAAAAGCALASTGAVLLAVSMEGNGSRKDFAKRHKRSLLAGIAEPVSHVAWGGATALVLSASLWAIAPAALALAVAAGVWAFRTGQNA